MKILLTPDAPNWAIANLCRSITKHNPQIQFKIVVAHPRGLGEAIPEIQAALREGIDIWHAMYWNSAIQLYDLIPELQDPKLKRILSHHNHYRLTKRDWKQFDMVTEWTDWGVNVLRGVHGNVRKVPFGIDLDQFSYITQYPPAEPRVGYIGRVASWKNLGEITRVSKELGYTVCGSGYIDKIDYWREVDKSNLEWNGGIGLQEVPPVHEKDELYKKMSVFVMYATEEKESGTMPLLEAMARGVPVMATEQGMARELIRDGENGIIFTPENFKERLQMVMENEPLRKKMREAAWQTIKNWPEERMAREFAKLYHELTGEGKPLVSVIITSYNHPESLVDAILSVDVQDYPNKEIIVADDGSDDPRVASAVGQLQLEIKTPIKFIRNQEKSGYGLAKMRNLAVMEALGNHLVIFQDRFKLDGMVMLEKIVMYTKPNAWGFGSKFIDGVLKSKKGFVENFSWILKEDLVRGGMFNERINIYGGQSQELRDRFTKQGVVFQPFPEVTCTEISVSRAANRRQDIWKAKWMIHKLYDTV